MMAPEVLILLWYYWTSGDEDVAQPSASNTLGPDITYRIMGPD